LGWNLIKFGDRHRPGSPRKEARASVSGGSPIQRFQLANERSLAEILSISDWRGFVPESIVLLAVIWFVQSTVLGVPTAPGVMPHPFWIPVLLMSSQYGVMGGLFATIAATALFFISGLPLQSATQDFYAYAGVVAGQPCAWFGSALVLGGLRSLHILHHTELQEQLDKTLVASEDLADGLERAVSEIERLERRIAVNASTLTSFLHGLGKFELNDRSSQVASIADLVRHGVGATSFVIYLEGARGLEPIVGVENDFPLPQSAISPLEPALLDEIRGRTPSRPVTTASDGAIPAHTPRWEPIRRAGSTEPVGVVVCHRLQPSLDPAIAARRLGDVCRVLAVLLSADTLTTAGAR
jgi:hypothetical protein